MSLVAEKPKPTDLERVGHGKFTWGRVVHIHEIGPYGILEFHPWKRKGVAVLSGDPDLERTEFHGYIDGRDTHQGYLGLDEALAGLIAYRAEGPNGRAATYFMRMIRGERS